MLKLSIYINLYLSDKRHFSGSCVTRRQETAFDKHCCIAAENRIKMMNYRKGRNVETELTKNDIQIDVLPEHFLWMHVCFNQIICWSHLCKLINALILLDRRWKVERPYRMSLNSQRMHFKPVNTVPSCGQDMVAELAKQFPRSKLWSGISHCIKLHGCAIKRNVYYFIVLHKLILCI